MSSIASPLCTVASGKRLKKELEQLKQWQSEANDQFNVVVEYDGEEQYKWIVTFTQPEETLFLGLWDADSATHLKNISPYSQGTFVFSLTFNVQYTMVDGKMKPPPYPFTAPIVQFHTKVYHSNVDGDTGFICQCEGCNRVLTGVAGGWKPNLSAARIVKQIASGIYLSTHSTDCPLRSDVAELYNSNRLQHDENARAWTKKYAIPGHTEHEDVEENGGNLKEEQQKEQKK